MDFNISFIKSISPDFNIRPGIIKANEYASLVDAKNIIKRAHTEASSIRKTAKKTASAKIERGYKEGMNLAKIEMAERLITAKIRSNQMIELAESDLLSLVKLTIQRLFGQLNDVDKVEGMIQSSLSTMRSDYRVLVHVVPEMVDEIKEKMPALIHDLKTLEYFEVVANATLKKEECVIEGDGGLIKCSVSKQFEKLNTIIENALGENITV
jgi:type III secretion protein L